MEHFGLKFKMRKVEKSRASDRHADVRIQKPPEEGESLKAMGETSDRGSPSYSKPPPREEDTALKSGRNGTSANVAKLEGRPAGKSEAKTTSDDVTKEGGAGISDVPIFDIYSPMKPPGLDERLETHDARAGPDEVLVLHAGVQSTISLPHEASHVEWMRQVLSNGDLSR